LSDLDGIILALKKFNQLVEGLKKTCSIEEALKGIDGKVDPKETEEKLNEVIRLSFDASKIGHIGYDAIQGRGNLPKKCNNK